MSRGPPFSPDDSSRNEWPDWREYTTQLDYPERDIRIIFPEEKGPFRKPHDQPADFGDFDPDPEDPDPDIWPLEDYDPGHPADVDDLICWRGSFPAPHVAWVTEEYLTARYGYNPVRQNIQTSELPWWHQPDDAKEEGDVEVVATNSSPDRMTLTEDRKKALTRIARLWNGEDVRGKHLLLDKCPAWMDFLGDLNQEELRRIVVDPSTDHKFAETFAEHSWYEEEQAVYASPQRILRKKVWYAPTQRGRTLINQNDAFPTLTGDSMEGLSHRVTVGLALIREQLKGRDTATYHGLKGYSVDVASRDDNGQVYAGEVITGHHNWQYHRKTYRKMKDLDSQGVTPYAVFDSRSTAYAVMNHWIREGLVELPTGTFDSNPKIEWGRRKVQDAYSNEHIRWRVGDWTTTDVLWRLTLGADGPDIRPSQIKSLNW
ncbi:hypothetical protein C475_19018 [Halosimplex carlsbadense 2-9-1]|uniref:Uncharacterized protein n=1 Tax=Halosimplex carlsbadense 2-9-1 TaxID=797114 RepID=M0CCX0_9EURY|nr:hypothetical protein [Halosimplex carlsbadense]ELZ21080.1 hypothetical protein C475_19018 [Halosimplex carlsbadense 2-9-1]